MTVARSQTMTFLSITISITLPVNMRNGSNYKIVRVHNGVAEIIPATVSDFTLSFNTDRFSSYGIIYTPGGTAGGAAGGVGTTTTSTDTAAEHKAYIKGYPDGTFRPVNDISRAEVVTML